MIRTEAFSYLSRLILVMIHDSLNNLENQIDVGWGKWYVSSVIQRS